jgi:hypothetical protein
MGKITVQLVAIRKILIAVGVIGAALLGMPQIPAVAASVAAPSPTVVPAPAPAGQATSDTVTIAATGCSPQAKGDNVHVSSSPPATASGHGWWLKGNCTAVKAQVTVQLQEFFSDGSWRNKGTRDTEDVFAGGGSSNRANGRAACTGGTALTGWRSVVTADVIGQTGLNQIITPTQNVNCRV